MEDTLTEARPRRRRVPFAFATRAHARDPTVQLPHGAPVGVGPGPTWELNYEELRELGGGVRERGRAGVCGVSLECFPLPSEVWPPFRLPHQRLGLGFC